MASLWALRAYLRAANADLARAHAQAHILELPGTQAEIENVRARVDSIIFEIEKKDVPELAALNQPPSTGSE